MEKELSQLVLKVLGPGGRFETMEQQMKALAETKGPSDVADAIKKALGQGAAKGMHSGWDGADEANFIMAHGRGKAVGGQRGKSFGDWLLWAGAGSCSTFDKWVAPCGHESRKGCSDFGVVEKVMKDFGSPRIVNKAPNAEGTGATGGFLVPPQFYMKLLQFVAEQSFVKALCTTLPMQGRELYFPYLNQQGTDGSGAAFPASNFYGGVYFSWTPEAATYSQTNPGFKSGRLVARDLVGITIASNQLLQDSTIALDTMLTTLFSEALAWQLDYAFLRGNGVNQPLGIVNAPGTISSTRAGSNNLLTSLSDMIGRAVNPVRDKNSYVFVMNQSVLPYLLRLTNGATNSPFLVWSNPAPAHPDDGPMARPWPATIWGIPVYFTEKLPNYATAGDICLLDMSKYLCGDRMSIQIEASQFPYFTSNQMVWRTIWRGDGQPWFNLPITLADTVNTVSPHVILAA